MNVSLRDFHAIHRLKKKSVVIAKFVNRRDATAILRAKRKLRETDAATKTKLGVDGKIYVNESLCPQYKRLFGICNSLYKMKKLSSSYTLNGAIYICRREGDVKSHVGHIDDLIELFGAKEVEDIILNHKKNSNR